MRSITAPTIRQLVDVGTKGKAAAEARCVRTVNFAALFAIVANGIFSAFYIATGDATLVPLILTNMGFIATTYALCSGATNML